MPLFMQHGTHTDGEWQEGSRLDGELMICYWLHDCQNALRDPFFFASTGNKKKKKKVYTVTSLNADMGLFKEKQKETH